MSTVTAILIDDEFSALMGLQQKLKLLFPEIEIMSTFQKPEDAISFLKTTTPNLVFLDIEMPRMNGFQLLSKLDEVNFQIIFVTAYSEFAIDALRRNAVDYVMKPVDSNELISAVKKALKIVANERLKAKNENLLQMLSETMGKYHKLMVPTAKGMSFIPEEEVLHLEGYDGYTKIHLTNNTEILSSYNLGRFEKMLGKTFFKCHKSHIVNIVQVRSFENEGYVVLKNEYRVPISKTHRKVFLDLFK